MRSGASIKIGVIGTGAIGRTVGGLWSRAGHEVRYGSRNAATAARNDGEIVCSVVDAVAFADVVFVAVPYGAWPKLAEEIATVLGSKVLIDASNPYPPRDGTFAVEAIEAHRGAGLPVAALLPLARIARAFSTVNAETQVTQAGRSAPRVGMPVAADSIDARAIACRLVADAGFDPVDIGPLARAALFDPGTPVYNTGMSADELRTSFAASAA